MCAISTGDILREEIRKGSTLGIRANNYIKRGDLVPDSDVIDMIHNHY